MDDQPTTPPSGPQQPQNPYFSSPAPLGPPPEGPPAYGSTTTAPLPVERRPRRAGLAAAVVATALLVGGAAGVGGAAAWNAYDDNGSSDADTASAPSTSQVVDTPDSPAPDGSVEQVAAKLLPSVVKINVSGSEGAGSGSGIILSSDGEILTNNHVAEIAGDGGSMSVAFNDGTHRQGHHRRHRPAHGHRGDQGRGRLGSHPRDDRQVR